MIMTSSQIGRPAASIDELLKDASARAATSDPDATVLPSANFGVSGDFTLFNEIDFTDFSMNNFA